MSLQNTFSTHLQDPRAIISNWKNNGARVAGYLSNNVPLEILHAAGLLPIHLSGDPALNPDRANEFMEPAFDPITRSVFDRLLRGHFDYLDLIVLPRGNDAQQRLYYYLCELSRSYPDYSLPLVSLVDVLNTLRPSTHKHNMRRLRQFVNFLDAKFSLNISDEQLHASIRVYNRSRDLLTELTQLRAKLPLSLKGGLIFSVYQAARSMPVEAFNQALESLLSEARQLPTEEAKRMVVAGNGLDHPALYELIEQQGASVVGDYHAYGNHFLNGRVPGELAPLEAISQYYQRDSRSCRSIEIDPRELVEFAREQKADGVIFFFLFGEEAWTWQQPKQKQALAEAGLPSIVFYDQAYKLNQDELSETLQTFIAGV